MKYIFIKGETKKLINGKTISSSIGRVLQQKGRHPTLLRLCPWSIQGLGDADPGIYGEVHVLRDGTEADVITGVFERACNIMLNKHSFTTFGAFASKALLREHNSASNGKRLISSETVYKHLLSQKIERLVSQNIVYRDGSTAQPDVLIVDVGETAPPILDAIAGFVSGLSKQDYEFVEVPCYDKYSPKVCAGEPSQETIDTSMDTPDSLSNAMDIFTPEHLFSSSWCFGPGKILCENFAQLIQKDLSDGKGAASGPRVIIISDVPSENAPYASLVDLVEQAAVVAGGSIKVEHLHLSEWADDLENALKSAAGVILPGGFGDSFLDQKLRAVEWARKNSIPFIGICLGFQLSVIEFAKNVLKLSKATSREFDPNTNTPVIEKIPGICCPNTSRDIFLGSFEVRYRGSAASDIYKSHKAEQRFRHRYALNPSYRAELESAGLEFLGSAAHNCIVMLKLSNHPFFVGVQYHPELGSTSAFIDPVIMEFTRKCMRKNN